MRRRDFLELAAAATVVAGGCRHAKVATSEAAPAAASRGKLRVAVIGAGGQGAENWRAIRDGGDRVVALCDVDETNLRAAQKELTRKQRGLNVYKDFRVMLDTERDLDAVFICTPDHGHAVQAKWALERNLPVYIEPPLARTVAEARQIHALAQEKQLPLWMGVQNRMTRESRRAANCLDTGIIGRIRSMVAWTSHPFWQQGIPRPDGTDPIPGTLDWDLWLGPAQSCPYKANVYHPYSWRGWCAFGTGALGEAGTSLLQLPFELFEIPPLTQVQCVKGNLKGDSYPKSTHLRFTFQGAKNGWFSKRPEPITLDWHDGGDVPDFSAFPQLGKTFGQKMPVNACLLVGEYGMWLMGQINGREHYLALNGEDRFLGAEKHPACEAIALPNRNISMQKTFLDRIRRGSKNSHALHFGYTQPMMDAILCGCVMQQLPHGLPLRWNAPKMRFEGEAEERANALVSQPVREGWA